MDRLLVLLAAGAAPAYILAKLPLPERNPVLFLSVLSFAAAVFFWREPEVIVDASRYFTQAKHLELYGAGYFLREWGRDISAWTDAPVIPFFYGLVFKYFGESRLPIQVFTTLLFSSTVLLTHMTGKALWNRETGFFAGVFLLGMPYLFSQIPLMLVDLPSTALLMLSVYTFLMALERGRSWIAFAAAALFLAFFSKYSAWLMLSVLPVILAVRVLRKEDTPEGAPRVYLSRGLAVAGIALLLIGAFFLYKCDVFSGQIRLLMSYQKPGLKRWSESYVSTFLFQIHPFITAAAVYSAYAAFRKRDPRYLAASWLALLIFALQIKRIRYSLPAFPMFALLGAYGLCELKNSELKKFIAFSVAVSSFTIALFAYLPFLETMNAVNITRAGEYLDSLNARDVEVFTLPPKDPAVNPAVAVPLLDLFTRKNIIYRYDRSSAPPAKQIEASPLRFTWEYKNPSYYSASGKDANVLATIGGPDDDVPRDVAQRMKDCRVKKTFDTTENIFSSQTFVTVCLH
ncbi:MAG TPA: glycosyltransferase family 39 protein [Dissulfurispiraceae bacterium]